MSRKAPAATNAEIETFSRATDSLRGTLGLAKRISAKIGHHIADEQSAWSSWVFLKLCVAGESLAMLATWEPNVDDPTAGRMLDHWSVAAMARNIIEATLMLSYLSEGDLTEEQWRLRKLVLWHHDAVTRYKMFRDLGIVDQANGLKQQFTKLREQIKAEPAFQDLDGARREKILAGTEMYVQGLRGIVRASGWDVKEFDGIYGYLSSHTHTSPVSFMRLDEHGIDFINPTGHQISLSAVALDQAHTALTHANEQMLRLFPAVKNE